MYLRPLRPSFTKEYQVALDRRPTLIMLRYLWLVIAVQTIVPYTAGFPAPEPQASGGKGLHT